MVQDTIRNLQDAFEQAELHDDRERLRELIDDDFVSIGPRGFVLDKEQWIDRHNQYSYKELDTTELDVRVYDGAAIVREVQRNRSHYENKELEFAFRVGHVWTGKDGDWKLVAIQFSPLAEAEAGR